MVLSQYSEIGGVENVVRALSKNLNKQGHEVVLIIRNRPFNTKKFEKFYSDVRILEKSTRYRDYLFYARRQIEKMDDIDVFHFHNWSTIFPFAFSKIKKVLTLHGTSTQVFFDFGELYKAIPMWFIEEFCMNIPDILTSITKYHLRYFKIFKKTEIIPNGVDLEEYNPKEYTQIKKYRKEFGIDNKKVILTVGKHVKQKGIEYLIKSLPFVKEKVNLIIPSKGPLTSYLKNIAKKIEKKTGSKIFFPGKVSKEELKKLYALCNVFVLPSLNEGLPLVLLEAMAFGKPIITTNVGGIPEIINFKRGILVEPKNAEQIKEAINKILTKERYGEKLGKNARNYVKRNLDWAIIVKKYNTIYEIYEKD